MSKESQAQIESRTFSELHLTPARLGDFGRIVRGARRGYVRGIDLEVVLPSYSKEKYGKFEDAEDQARNNEIFTSLFRSVFSSMLAWPRDESHRAGITLSMRNIYSPSDFSRQSKEVFKARQWERIRGGKDLFHLRYSKSYLCLFPFKAGEVLLESVEAITNLYIEGSAPRHVWPASCSQIIATLPRLQIFSADLADSEKRDLELRKSARNGKGIRLPTTFIYLHECSEFAESTKIWPASIHGLMLSYHNSQPADEAFSPPNLLSGPDRDQDLLCVHLRNFSQQLTSLTLHYIVISPSLFWPLPRHSQHRSPRALLATPHLPLH